MVDKVEIETEDNQATLTITNTLFPGTYYLCDANETPLKNNVNITLNTGSKLIIKNTDQEISVKVTSNNQPVTTGTITIFEDDNTLIENATLDSNGEYIFTYNKNTIGEHTLKARYNGTSNYYWKQSDDYTITIVNTTTRISILDMGSGYVPYNITGKVTTIDNIPVDDGYCICKVSGLTLKDENQDTLKFYVQDNGIVLINMTTNMNITLKTNRTYYLSVKYTGSSKFSECETNSIAFTVNG